MGRDINSNDVWAGKAVEKLTLNYFPIYTYYILNKITKIVNNKNKVLNEIETVKLEFYTYQDHLLK